MTYKILSCIFLIVSCSSPKQEESKQIGLLENKEPAAAKDNTDQLSPSATKKLSFKALPLLSGRVQLEVPSQLHPMDEKMFLLKYPMENPENTKAYSNEDGTVSLLISPRKEKASQADLPKYQQMLYESFGKNPSIDFRKSEIKKINGRDFIVIEMITPAVDTEVYNLMFVTSSEGRLLMSTFNCTVDHLKEWQPLAEQIVSSVKVRD